jgi:DNA mismatch repair protein MutL
MEALEMKRIIELPKNVADKIAAGEVVDRPVSVVKELTENSIDAGATSIIVEIRNGGKSYIRVTDNGSGIAREDADLAFKRHATSKIRSASDLFHITSLGFRGEALASIAAVSKVELITKTAGEKFGVRIRVEGGEVLEKEDTGCPEGTTVIVEDLFFNTPARLKFLKPDASESTLVIDLISKMALAYPHIKIRLVNNGNILFSTAGKGDIYSGILTIFSRQIGEQLIRLEEADGPMSLEAFISAPNNSKTNRKSQIFFVNGRYINSKVMENAVSEAYREKLFEGRYPIAFLFLRVAPEKLDVNIHPNKKEVRFDEEQAVKDFLTASIQKGLKTKEAIPEIKDRNPFQFRQPGLSAGTPGAAGTAGGTAFPVQNPGAEDGSFRELQKSGAQVNIKNLMYEIRRQELEAQAQLARRVGEAEEAYGLSEKGADGPAETASGSAGKADPGPAGSANSGFDIGSLTVTGSIFGTYITAVDEDSFYLIDQHAAHERIFYEQLLAQYQNGVKAQQLILTPLVISVTHAVKNDAAGILDFLGNLGFHAEEFGPAAYIVKAIPVFMELDEARDFIDYIFDNASEEIDLKNQRKIDAIIMNACKKAVKANDVLDSREIESLLADLARTKNPYSCPHGRPTFVRLKKYEIEKMFKRV